MPKSEIRRGAFVTSDGGHVEAADPRQRAVHKGQFLTGAVHPGSFSKSTTDNRLDAIERQHVAAIAEMTNRLRAIKAQLDIIAARKRK